MNDQSLYIAVAVRSLPVSAARPREVLCAFLMLSVHVHNRLCAAAPFPLAWHDTICAVEGSHQGCMIVRSAARTFLSGPVVAMLPVQPALARFRS
jgi:hypothetical protein